MSSKGIDNRKGEITINNCHVKGTHSGVSAIGKVNVNGGTYEGFLTGGIYFAGDNVTHYVKNATIKGCAMPDGYTSDIEGNKYGLYIGSGSNINVYMDNCYIEGSVIPINYRVSTDINNYLYISNSTVNENRTALAANLPNDTHRLFIGQGCNFKPEDTNYPDNETVVKYTGEIYAN